jgi:hypothetical protein
MPLHVPMAARLPCQVVVIPKGRSAPGAGSGVEYRQEVVTKRRIVLANGEMTEPFHRDRGCPRDSYCDSGGVGGTVGVVVLTGQQPIGQREVSISLRRGRRSPSTL